MYDNGRELRNGYRKSLWAAFGSPLGAVGVAAALAVVYVLPPVALETPDLLLQFHEREYYLALFGETFQGVAAENEPRRR